MKLLRYICQGIIVSDLFPTHVGGLERLGLQVRGRGRSCAVCLEIAGLLSYKHFKSSELRLPFETGLVF